MGWSSAAGFCGSLVSVSHSNRLFGAVLAIILALQFAAGSWHIGDPFYDGRYHYYWGPPFWLLHAQATNDVGLAAAYWGVEGYHSHPQLIGPIIASWTGTFGYTEASIRFLALIMAVITTALFASALRAFVGARFAILSAAVFAALPIIYMFGKKLDQENLLSVFLALAWLGVGILGRSRRIGLSLITASSFCMMLSDWSGALFAIAIVFAAYRIYAPVLERAILVRTALYSTVAVAVALLLFLVQSFLQSGDASFWQFVHEYYELWQYRSGATSTGLGAYWWSYRQFWFLSDNFSFPIFGAGLLGLFLALRGKAGLRDRRFHDLAILATATFVASLAYMLLVPQASGIHTYFQFYLALPIAVGVVIFAYYCAGRFFPKTPQAPLGFAAFFFACTALATGQHYYTFVHESTWGDQSDIALLRHVRELPIDAVVTAPQDHPLTAAWFDGPNIRYYAGRDIKSYQLDAGVPFSDYQIVPRTVTEEYAAFISTKDGYGTSVRVTTDLCSTDFCILHLVDRARH